MIDDCKFMILHKMRVQRYEKKSICARTKCIPNDFFCQNGIKMRAYLRI